MSIEIGRGLEDLLNGLGYFWPEVFEGDLVTGAHLAMSHAATLTAHKQTADAHAQTVADQNTGDDISASQGTWSASGQPSRNLPGTTEAMYFVAAGLLAAAAVVTTFKVVTAGQLVDLAAGITEAVATAGVTFGASLLEIPVFKEITQRIIGLLQNLGLQIVMTA